MGKSRPLKDQFGMWNKDGHKNDRSVFLRIQWHDIALQAETASCFLYSFLSSMWAHFY